MNKKRFWEITAHLKFPHSQITPVGEICLFVSKFCICFTYFPGENCVHIAAQRDQADILQLLIQHGADINAKVSSIRNLQQKQSRMAIS